jgi:hypothetical protein
MDRWSSCSPASAHDEIDPLRPQTARISVAERGDISFDKKAVSP